MDKIVVHQDYDYVGIYMTDKCLLKCPYCLTRHYGSQFIGRKDTPHLTSDQWIKGINRLVLPKDVPVSLQRCIGHTVGNIAVHLAEEATDRYFALLG